MYCNKTLASEYNNMKVKRESWLEAAKQAAKYSIPAVMPEESELTKSRNKSILKSPNQSIVADGINNLASKVTLTMLPPNQTFYRFKMDDTVIKSNAKLSTEDEKEFEQDINKGLSKIESLLLDYMENSSDRVCLGEAMKHLYITGNVLMVYDKDLGLKYYPLSRYVVKRDYYGNIQKVITEESIGFTDLPDYIQKQILEKNIENKDEEHQNRLEDKEFVIYTGFKKRRKKWEIYQEVEGFKLDKSAGTFPLDICPVIPLRYVRVDGEDYGRGLVEEYFGDISYLDTICLAIKQAALAGAKLVMLVKPTGQTSIKKLASAKNGDFVVGNPDDVAPLQANKYYDMQTAQAEADKIEKRLNRVFVMKAAIQRDAERVTAEEIRQMAADLEEALGNHYSLMAKEFQLAYVKLVYFHLRKKKNNNLPNLINDKSIKLTITTGLEALERTSDLNKLMTFFEACSRIAQFAQPLGNRIDISKILNRVAVSMNLDISDCCYSEEEMTQIQNQLMQQNLLDKVSPNLINKAGDMMIKQQEGNSNNG